MLTILTSDVFGFSQDVGGLNKSKPEAGLPVFPQEGTSPRGACPVGCSRTPSQGSTGLGRKSRTTHH